MMMGYEKRSIEKTAELLLLLAWFLEEEKREIGDGLVLETSSSKF